MKNITTGLILLFMSIWIVWTAPTAFAQAGVTLMCTDTTTMASVPCGASGNPIATTATGAPTGVSATQTGGSIATQNVFQVLSALNTSRKGCTIQNTGASDILYIFFGSNGSATKPTSFQLSNNQTVSCTTLNGQPISNNISATCASATPANCTYVMTVE